MNRPAPGAPYPWYRMRSARYDEIYVSPHMDDAVYSCGGQIALSRARGARVLIITVFGHGASPESGPGVFRNYTERKREEQAASERLDVDHLWLNYPDLLIRKSGPVELVRYALPFVSLHTHALVKPLEAALFALCTKLLAEGGQVFFPLAVGAHPDHRIVFEAGYALASGAPWRQSFYEDVPYAQVPAVRGDRLHFLGLPRPLKAGDALRAFRETRDFLAAHAPSWQRPFITLLVGGHELMTRALFRLFGRRDAFMEEGDLMEREIDDVVAEKVAAMQAYATQTEYFFPAGEAIYGALVRSHGRYVERYWTPAKPTLRARSAVASPERQAELARADRLVNELVS